MNNRFKFMRLIVCLPLLLALIFVYFFISNSIDHTDTVDDILFKKSFNKTVNILAYNTENKKKILQLFESFFRSSGFVKQDEFSSFSSHFLKNDDLVQVCWKNADLKEKLSVSNDNNLCDKVDFLDSSKLLPYKDKSNVIMLSTFVSSSDLEQKGRVLIFFKLDDLLINEKAEGILNSFFVVDKFKNEIFEVYSETNMKMLKIEGMSLLKDIITFDDFKLVYFAKMIPLNGSEIKRSYSVIVVGFVLAGFAISGLLFLSYKKRDEVMLLVDSKTAELKKSNEELSHFSFIMAHDLREPLRGIRNFSSFLSEDYQESLDEKGIYYIETIEKLSKRLEQYLEDLRVYFNLSRQRIISEKLDLKELIEEVIDTFIFDKESREIDIEVAPNLPVLQCDKTQFTLILSNLLLNAIKYNESDNVKVKIDYSCEDELHVFRIKDNGIGIKQEHWERVFQIFKRLHSKDAFGGGSGIGLNIVQRAVSTGGGTIKVLSSTVGVGTIIEFSLKELS